MKKAPIVLLASLITVGTTSLATERKSSLSSPSKQTKKTVSPSLPSQQPTAVITSVDEYLHDQELVDQGKMTVYAYLDKNRQRINEEALKEERKSTYIKTTLFLNFIRQRWGEEPIQEFHKKLKDPAYTIPGQSYVQLITNPIRHCLVQSDGSIERYIADALLTVPEFPVKPSLCWVQLCNRHLPDGKKYDEENWQLLAFKP